MKNLKKIFAAVLVASLFAGFGISGVSFASCISGETYTSSKTSSFDFNIDQHIIKITYDGWTTPSGEVVFYPCITSRSDDDCVSNGYTNWVKLEIDSCGSSKVFTTYSPFKDQNGTVWALKFDRSGFEPYEGPYSFVWVKELNAYVYTQNPKNQDSYWDEDSKCYEEKFPHRLNRVSY